MGGTSKLLCNATANPFGWPYILGLVIPGLPLSIIGAIVFLQALLPAERVNPGPVWNLIAGLAWNSFFSEKERRTRPER